MQTEARGSRPQVPRDRRDGERGAPTSLLDPVAIARSVWNSKLLILAITVLGLGLAILVSLTTPKIYMATTQILVDPRDLKVVANEVTPNGLPSEATLALVESQTSVIMSSNVLSRVIAEAKLEEDPEFNGTARNGLTTLLPKVLTEILASPDATLRNRELVTIAKLRKALTVGREAKSFVINLSVDSQDPEKAATLANMTADVFIGEQGRVQSDAARRATEALSSRLSELRKRVVDTEGRVEDYKSQNALIGVGGRLVDDDYIVRINDQLAKVRGDIPALRVKAESMDRTSVEDVVRGTLPEELVSEALVRLRQSYSDLAQQAAVLATKLGPRHPQRLASEGALTAARQAISGELSRIVAATQTELARATETERNLTTQIDGLKVKQIETSGSFVKLRELEREVDASRAVYEAFLLRARETSEQESLNTANVRIISDATPPLQPAGLSRKVIVAAGTILGLLTGIGLAALIAVIRMSRALFRNERRLDEENASAAAERGESRAPLPEAVQDAPTGVDADPVPMRPGLRDERESPRRNPTLLHEVDLRPQPRSVVSDEHEHSDAPGMPSTLHDLMAPLSADARDSRQRDATAEAIAREAADRASLRERVRALSVRTQAEVEFGQDGQEPLRPEIATLKNDIDTVKDAIADIRRRRMAGRSSSAG